MIGGRYLRHYRIDRTIIICSDEGMTQLCPLTIECRKCPRAQWAVLPLFHRHCTLPPDSHADTSHQSAGLHDSEAGPERYPKVSLTRLRFSAHVHWFTALLSPIWPNLSQKSLSRPANPVPASTASRLQAARVHHDICTSPAPEPVRLSVLFRASSSSTKRARQVPTPNSSTPPALIPLPRLKYP